MAKAALQKCARCGLAQININPRLYSCETFIRGNIPRNILVNIDGSTSIYDQPLLKVPHNLYTKNCRLFSLLKHPLNLFACFCARMHKIRPLRFTGLQVTRLKKIVLSSLRMFHPSRKNKTGAWNFEFFSRYLLCV